MKRMLKLFSASLLLLLSLLLVSCSDTPSDSDEVSLGIDEMLEECMFMGNWYGITPENAKNAYIEYFKAYPNEFDSFYEERMQEREERGKCMLYPPSVTFDVVMPNGEVREYRYVIHSNEIHNTTIYSNNVWDTYEYRYFVFNGLYTGAEDGAPIFDSELKNIATVTAESLSKTSLYARVEPANVSVRLNLDGGECAGEDLETEFSLKVGEDILPFMTLVPEKYGYTFAGWKYKAPLGDRGSKDAVIDTSSLEPEKKLELTEENFRFTNALEDKNTYKNGEYQGKYYKEYSVELTAIYEPILHEITCLNPDGSVYENLTLPHGSTVYQQHISPINAFEYKGWTRIADSSILFDSFVLEDDVTLYPVFAAKKKVIIYISDLAVIEREASDSYPFILTLVIPQGYKSGGWYLDSEYKIPVESTLIEFDKLASAYYLKLVPKETDPASNTSDEET